MALTAPEWLTQHGGSLEVGPDGRTYVLFDGEPQYRVAPVPVGGQYGCVIMQTINGRRVDSTGKAPTEEDALRAGLEDLRKALGW